MPTNQERLEKINIKRAKLKESGQYLVAPGATIKETNFKKRKSKPKGKFLGKKRKGSKKPIHKASFGEKKIATWLLKNGIKFKIEKEFADLINPLTNQRLRFDFYLHEHKMCIEFDGRQHFEAADKFDKKGDSLAGRIFRDSFKNEYCEQKGLKLIRIKYNEVGLIANILKEVFFGE